MQKVSIIGLGLIGGSLGLALKAPSLSQVEVTGYDSDSRAAHLALSMGAIDKAAPNLEAAAKAAELLIIATPILVIRGLMEDLGPLLKEGCVVTDTGSTKTQIMKWADEFLPSYVDFVGGHPMAGKEEPGVQGADKNLFREATYCVIPSQGASASAVDMVTSLAERVGAIPYFPEAAEHDTMVAAISHLPLIASSALASTIITSPSWREMSRLAATGFRDITRLASTDPFMSTGICLTNREAIAHWLQRFIQELKEYKKLVDGEDEGLKIRFQRAAKARNDWIAEKSVPVKNSSAHVQSAKEHWAGMFLGEGLMKKAKGILDLPKDKHEKDVR